MRQAVLSTLVALFGALFLAHPVAAQQDHSSHGAHTAHADGFGMHGAEAGDFATDMGLVHELFLAHESIRRTVTNLPDGVRTVTESDDPRVAEAIKEHVVNMDRRLVEGEIFNVRSSRISVIFENADKISTTIEETPSGVIFVQTTDDTELVSVLQGHAREVDEFVRDGMAAMHGSAAGGGEAARDEANHANHGGADQGDGTDHATHRDAGHAHGGDGAGDHEHGEHDHGSGSAGGGER